MPYLQNQFTWLYLVVGKKLTTALYTVFFIFTCSTVLEKEKIKSKYKTSSNIYSTS